MEDKLDIGNVQYSLVRRLINYKLSENKNIDNSNCSESLESVRKFLLGLPENFLRSSYFSMNLLFRAGKILFNRRVESSLKVKQASIPDAGYEEHHKFPK